MEPHSQEVERPQLYLLYHELTPQKTGYAYALTASAFGEHLQLFRRLRADDTAGLQPEITFDDGHASNFDLALPLLLSAALTARFFITAGWISERPGYMRWEQLRELGGAGQAIGAHGWSHKLLTHCSDVELETELGAARLLLEDKLGIPITTMSLPGGRYNRRVLAAAERAGYRQVFTSVPSATSASSAPLIGRLNLRAQVTGPWLESLLRPETGVLRQIGRQHRVKQAAQRTLGDRLYAKLWGLLNQADAAGGPA